jgi:hypothetical protein
VHENELKWVKFLNLFGLFIFTNGYFPFRYRGYFKNKLLIGFFESDKYFLPIREKLKEEFKVKDIEKNVNTISIINHIDRENSICVGVRKGDFVSKSNKSFCDICTPAYYEKGVEYLKQSMEVCTIYVFTDDVQWAKENLHFMDQVIYITSSVSGQIKPWEMLEIMTYFRYYVISNSTYFWWGQFLSKAEQPKVVAPSMWRSTDQDFFQDIYEDHWILIDPE